MKCFWSFRDHCFQHKNKENYYCALGFGQQPPGLLSLRRQPGDDYILFTGNLVMFVSSFTTCRVREPQMWAEPNRQQRDCGVHNFSASTLRLCIKFATKRRTKAAPRGGEAGAAHDHGG